MNYSYFPGCTLRTHGKALDTAARLSAAKLGIELRELPQWQCCGGVYPLGSDEIASKLPAVRALSNAENGKLVTMCSACHHVLTRVNLEMQGPMAEKVRNYADIDYHGQAQVIHFLELLRDEVGFENLKKQVVKPFTGRKIGAYYGCLLLRPGKELAFDDPEAPKLLEEFIRALGGEPVIYPYRNECCGGYQQVKDPEHAKMLSGRVLESAGSFGAEILITACPLCRFNLNRSGDLPVYYFTQLLAQALGVEEETV